MSYFDGFVIPVPSTGKSEFLRHASTVDPVFLEHGALRVVECWGADLKPGQTTDFQGAVAAKDDETVTRWHQAGLAAGGTDDGAPGPRERAPNNSVGAYLRDPDGNKICAFHMRH